MMNSIPVVSSGCCTKAELVLGGGALPVRFSRTAAGAAAAECAGCCFTAVFVVVEVFAVVVPDALAASSFQRVRGFGAPNESRAGEVFSNVLVSAAGVRADTSSAASF